MEILNQFGINPILLAAQIVNFFILLFILKKFLYKPILKVLETRKQKIEESLKNAEEIEKKLAEISTREEEALLKAAKEGEKIIKEAGEAASQTIEEGKKKYQQILEQALEDAKKATEVERVKLKQEVKENISDIVAMALEKITGTAINKKQQKELIEKEVKNLS